MNECHQSVLSDTDRNMRAARLKELLANGRAKIEPFNTGYVRLFMARPKFDMSKISDAMNRFFAEGGPDYNPPVLVPKAIADEAVRDLATDQSGTPA